MEVVLARSVVPKQWVMTQNWVTGDFILVANKKNNNKLFFFFFNSESQCAFNVVSVVENC